MKSWAGAWSTRDEYIMMHIHNSVQELTWDLIFMVLQQSEMHRPCKRVVINIVLEWDSKHSTMSTSIHFP